MYHVSAQGVDERMIKMINVHYYYYKLSVKSMKLEDNKCVPIKTVEAG